MYNVYHGSWRDFGTAVGAIVCTEMNTIFGATFVGRWFVDVFCSLRSHGTRFAYGRLRAQALSQPCLVKGRWRGVLSGDDKLTTANLCDRKKTPMLAR